MTATKDAEIIRRRATNELKRTVVDLRSFPKGEAAG